MLPEMLKILNELEDHNMWMKISGGEGGGMKYNSKKPKKDTTNHGISAILLT